MEREILFKGKRVDNGEWVEGYYVFTSNKYHQILTGKWSNKTGSHHSFEVHPETVCQFTGLTDKNGVKIFEGDKFQHEDEDDSYYLVEFEPELCKFCINAYSYSIGYGEGSQEIIDDEISKVDTNFCDLTEFSDDEVIGNIHDL